MKQLSQLPDECTVDTLHARLSYKPTFVSNPETSQNLPKQPKRSTPMSFSLEVQQYFALEEISKKPFKQTVKRKTLIEHRTQPKQQVQVILKDDFKYCRKSLQLQNNSATQYKQETLEDRIHRYSIKSKQTQGSKIPSQLEQIREDQTEVDEEQEHYFQKQKSRYHYYLKKAKNVKNSIQFVQSVRRFGTLEMCLGLEDGNEVTYFRRNNEFVAKIN